MKIEQSTFDFLKELKENNNRDWFNAEKPFYTNALENTKSVFTSIYSKLEDHDEIEKQKVYRIYRDVRFSKDKTPYNPRFATSFSRLGKSLRGGYFVDIKPNESMVAGGFWSPEKEDLFRIRKEFETDDSEIREIISDTDFINFFGGELLGDELKSAPKGFSKEHPAIDLIRKKRFVAIRRFSDEEVLSEGFANEVNQTFLTLRPFFDLMSDILTTNLDGESLI